TGDDRAIFDRCEALLERWRGRPFADLEALGPDALGPEAVRARARVEDAVETVATLRLHAAVAIGRWAWAVDEARRLVDRRPHDERRWALLVEALDLAGSRGDALAAHEQARRRLAEDLGIQPGPLLRDAEAK